MYEESLEMRQFRVLPSSEEADLAPSWVDGVDRIARREVKVQNRAIACTINGGQKAKVATRLAIADTNSRQHALHLSSDRGERRRVGEGSPRTHSTETEFGWYLFSSGILYGRPADVSIPLRAEE